MPVPKVIVIDRLPALLFGSMLSAGGLLHMWFHSQWGVEDWGVVVVIGTGAGVMFNREIVRLIHAWRGRAQTDEHPAP